jgi:RHH-type proline utilization regulon transcriptional repressor/proline dehydrogenase/delta 1-pyrroline-5-carboxylate dehydrogenase
MIASKDLTAEAVELAEELLVRSTSLESAGERSEGEKLAALMDDPQGKELTFHLTDRILRIPVSKRAAKLFRDLLKTYGAPAYLKPFDRFLMKLGAAASIYLPSVVMPAISRRLRKESKDVILPADPKSLAAHTAFRQKQHAEINLNVLGEAVLSEKEAQHRLQQNMDALSSGQATYISVKLSAIFSQINLTAYDETRDVLAERLRLLYRAAQAQTPSAFVNLDMEEYRDLQLTIDVFKMVLSEPEFVSLRAGLVLQSYLPDAFPIQQELTEWAKERGTPIKIRLVKGANLAMERVDAVLHHWEQAPYGTKTEVDANFKRMLNFACLPENAPHVNLGVASHNLFDLSYALVVREEQGVEGFVEIEMLEGMASPQARAVLEKAEKVLFYAPVVGEDDFEAAIAYLIRRLDENTTEGNFLRDLFEISPGNLAWTRQREAFLEACASQDLISVGPRRFQNRLTEDSRCQEEGFANAADTDFSLPANQEWLSQLLGEPLPQMDTSPIDDPVVIEASLKRATESAWGETPLLERARLIRMAGVELARSRGDLIAVMNREAKKAPAEGDVEVSEAIDFANYYATSFLDAAWQDGVSLKPIGPVLITPPWNFPCAIPCGGILAALIAGNPVIIKPAPEVIATARVMVEALWRAGIPRDALQFLPVPDNEIGQSLVTDPRISALILTGSSLTAEMFLGWRPDLRIHAETSGKNALVITSAADPDLAIKDLVKSAFGHSGQKCSAASVALVERSLIEKTSFLDRLREAAASLVVGPATSPSSVVTPLVQLPSDELLRGLTQLDDDERWLLEPSQPDPEDPCLWTPGIRVGVKAGSWIHRTELFGPVLSVIAFDSLEEAVAIQNSSDFGLTGGIHSLDPVELDYWRANVEVGNAYINRSITGAIVQRQPFGGWKNSSLGPGAKAGGPNYVSQFVAIEEVGNPRLTAALSSDVEALMLKILTGAPPEDLIRLQSAAENAAFWWRNEFSKDHDLSALEPESNVFRYLPGPAATLRLTPGFQNSDFLISLIMATTAGVSLTLSSADSIPPDLQKMAMNLGVTALIESDEDLVSRLDQNSLTILRTPGVPSVHLHSRNHHAPVTAHARFELLPYLFEQSISETKHRHGRISEN